MAEDYDITEAVRQIVKNAEFIDASCLDNFPELRAAKKLKFSRREFNAMRDALRTERILSVSELTAILVEAKRKENEAVKEAELDGSMFSIGGVYLFDQEAPLDLFPSAATDEGLKTVLDYEPLTGDELDSGDATRASSRSTSVPTGDVARAPSLEPLGDLTIDEGELSEDDEDSASDGELPAESAPGEAEEVASVDPGLECDRRIYIAWNFPATRPVGSSIIPRPALLPADRVSLLEFLCPLWLDKGRTAFAQLRTPAGRAEINAYLRSRQTYLPELGKFLTVSHMALQAGDSYYIHAPTSPPYTLQRTILSQLYINRKFPLDCPEFLLVITDAGVFPLERLFVAKDTPLEMTSTVPSARPARGPTAVPRFNPSVPPPVVITRLVRTGITTAASGEFENTQFQSHWSTVVSRRANPRVLRRPAPADSDAPSTSTSAQRPVRIIYAQPPGKRSLPHDHVKCEQCGNVLKLARH